MDKKIKYAVTTKEGSQKHYHYFTNKKDAQKFKKWSNDWKKQAKGTGLGYNTYTGPIRKLKTKKKAKKMW